MADSIKYFSLDEARMEIKKRKSDLKLISDIKSELGDRIMTFFKENIPRSVLFRQLISPDNGLTFFHQSSKYIGTKATIVEFLDDIFVSFNEEKKGYGRIHVGDKVIDIIDFHSNEKKPLKMLSTLNGNNLVEFHHKLMQDSGLDVDIFDCSDWFKSIGKAKDYYYYFLLHFITNGVLFETFIIDSEDEKEMAFSNQVVIPAIRRIEDKFGVSPIIVKMYPDEQSADEDLYWWSYPPYIQNKIVGYNNEGI